MTTYQIVVSTLLVIIFVLDMFRFSSWWKTYRRRKKQYIKRKPYFTEVMFKILHNPFEDKWMWCRLNPESHIWEWYRVATDDEILSYEPGVMLTVSQFSLINRGNDNG